MLRRFFLFRCALRDRRRLLLPSLPADLLLFDRLGLNVRDFLFAGFLNFFVLDLVLLTVFFRGLFSSSTDSDRILLRMLLLGRFSFALFNRSAFEVRRLKAFICRGDAILKPPK